MFRHPTTPLLLTLALLCCHFAAPARAEAPPAPSLIPADAAWVMRMDMTKFSTSKFGKKMMELVDQERPGAMKGMEHLTQTLGIDPLTDLGEVVMFGTGFERSDVRIAIDLGEHPGNLEGLLIAAPGYASTDYRGDLLIHAIDSDDAKAVDPKAGKLYISILPHPTQARWVALAAHLEPNLKTMIDDVRDRKVRLADQPLAGNQFMHVALLRKPENLPAGNPQQANIANMIDAMELTGSVDEELSLTLSVKAINPARGRQMAQLMQGAIAGVQLAALNNPEAQRLGVLVQNIVVQHEEGSPAVSAVAKFTPDQLMDLRPDKLDL